MYMSVFFACMSVCHVLGWCLWKSQNIKSSGIGVRYGCELLLGARNLEPRPLVKMIALIHRASCQAPDL